MKVVDTNVLLYTINADAIQHPAVSRWWNRAMNGDETLGLPWIVLLGFLRIATNPRAFAAPLEPDAAMARVDAWLSHRIIEVLREKDDHWTVLRSLLADAGTAGNLTSDAHLAALAIGHGAALVSCDADFARFAGLRWENPLVPE